MFSTYCTVWEDKPHFKIASTASWPQMFPVGRQVSHCPTSLGLNNNNNNVESDVKLKFIFVLII